MNKLLTSLQNDKPYSEVASVSYQAQFHEDGPLVCNTFDSLTPSEESRDHQTGSLVGPRAGQDAVKTTNCVPNVNLTPKSRHCTDQPTRPTQDGTVQSMSHCLLEHHAKTIWVRRRRQCKKSSVPRSLYLGRKTKRHPLDSRTWCALESAWTP